MRESFFIQDYTIKDLLQDVGIGSAYQGTLNYWRHFWPVVLSTVGFLAGGYFLILWVRDPGLPKRRAWVPSLLSSGLMLVTCAPLFIWWFLTEVTRSGEGAALKLTTNSAYTDRIIVFFNTFLWYDMLVSGIFFPGHMEILAGWIHHILYVILCSNAVYWHWTYGFAIMFIEELPTLLLALGRCYPQWHTEKGFGYTFAILRIGLHLYICILTTIYCRQKSYIWLAAWLSLCMHAWWFTGWVARQRRLQQEKQRAAALPHDDPEKDLLIDKASDYRLDSMLIEETTRRKKSGQARDLVSASNEPLMTGNRPNDLP